MIASHLAFASSYFFVSSAFLPLLAASTKANPGRSAGIVNISSISGITRTTQHHASYNVSKAATIHLNTLLAQEFSRKGVKVRVNRWVFTLYSPTLAKILHISQHRTWDIPL